MVKIILNLLGILLGYMTSVIVTALAPIGMVLITFLWPFVLGTLALLCMGFAVAAAGWPQ